MSQDRFDWQSDPHIVVPAADAVAVYKNDAGDVVIRRQAWWPDETDDAFIVLPADRVAAVLQAIAVAAGIDGSAVTARTAGAERQRRYRQRNAGDGDERNAVTPKRNAGRNAQRNGPTLAPMFDVDAET
jgi:hypothetical protein